MQSGWETLFLLLGVVAVGFVCGRGGLFTAEQAEGFEVFLFRIGIPASLFSATQQYPVQDLVEWSFLASYLLCFGGVAIPSLLYSFFQKHPPSRMILQVLGAGYINAALYSVPVLTLLLNDPRAAIGINLLQVLVIQSFFVTLLSHIHHRDRSLLQKLLKSVVNPLVILPLLGFAIQIFQFPFPRVGLQLMAKLGAVTPSFSLFVLGLMLSFIHWDKHVSWIEVGISLGLKNVLHPLFALGIGKYLFHLETYWLQALVLLASAPTGFMVYLLSKQFSGPSELIRRNIAWSCILSLASLWGWAKWLALF